MGYTIDGINKVPALKNVGGDDISITDGTSIPIYAFLINGWRIRPQEANHTLNITDGILVVDGGGDPFLDTLGDYTVRINYQQPVQAIVTSTGGGGSDATEIWNHSIEGTFSAKEVMRLLVAVAAGKTEIETTNNGAVVTFRDINDTKDRIIAEMENSKRINITLDKN